MNDEFDKIRESCWEKSFHAFGTASIFEKHARTFRRKVRLLGFFGLVLPVTAGGVVLSFGVDYPYLRPVLLLTGVVAVIQFIVSLWSLFARWEDSLSYSLESLVANRRLSDSYRELAKNPPSDRAEFNMKLALLGVEDQLRIESDNKQGITYEEKRIGMRAALYQFQKQCAKCGKIPESLKPTGCPTCG